MQVVNIEQAQAWDGHEGDVWTEHADRYEAAGWRLWNHLADAAVIGATDAVVDIGCGTGKATRDAARIAASGSAVGLDLSARMLACARERADDEGVKNIDFIQADAQIFPFPSGRFDVAISSFGAMFFNDPVAAFTNIVAGLRPGGTLALLTWRGLQENEWLVSLRAALALGRDLPVPPPEAPTPFALADQTRVRTILDQAGMADIEFVAIDEPMEFGTDADDAYSWVKDMGIVEGLSNGLDNAARAQAVANVRQLLADHETPDGVLLGTAAWLITAVKS